MHTCSFVLVIPFTKHPYGCKALLHTLVKYSFVEFLFSRYTFYKCLFFFLSLLFLFATQEKCNIMQFRLRLKMLRLRYRYRISASVSVPDTDTEIRSDTTECVVILPCNCSEKVHVPGY